MAALVRHDTATQAEYPRTDTGILPDASEIVRLYEALDSVSEQDNPRTARLLASGRSKIAQKLIEEAGEIALEAVRHRARNIVRESADLIYHMVVLWHECGIAPEEIWAEMRQRADKLGIAEKLPKAPDRHAAAIGFGK
jgi:phosphoribosyl-ATP pyrophosphohydrolase